MTETEPLDPGDIDQTFNEGLETGYDIAAQETQEQMADLLADAGFDDDEIEEALYDPAPGRRRHRRHRRMRRAFDPDPAPRRRRRSRRRAYDPDPAPRRRRSRKSKKGRKGRKGKLAKFRKFVLPAATVGSFYMSYSDNAKKRNLSVIDALKYDLANWSADKTIKKIEKDPLPVVGAIGIPLGRKFIPGANSGMMALAVDLVQGILTGQAITQVLDEPAPVRQAQSGSCNKQVVVETQPQVQQPEYYNPYGGY